MGRLFFGSFLFKPRTLTSFKNYTFSDFLTDLAAGIGVGIIALPLAMAFGIASGVKPEQGIYTAIFAGFLVSLLGGSKVQIGGPTGAFIVIVAGIIQQYGYQNLVLCTLMAGAILVLMGLTGLGTLIKFIPYPVTTGFTSGIAVLIALSQVKDFFGLQMETVPAEFFHKISAYSHSFSSFSAATLGLSSGSLLIVALWPRYVTKKIPGSIIAMIVGTLVTLVFHLPVETIGSHFGGVPSGMPTFQIPHTSLAALQHLISPAITIALLAAIESLLSAVVADGLCNDRHDSNTELVAQGIANLAVPFFGGIPATGAIARTSANVQFGARTPLAGMIHAVTLLGIILVAAPLAKYVPLAVLSAILMMVCFRMGEWSEFARLRRMPKSDAIVFAAAFLLTVILDLTVAVEVGLILAAALFVGRIADTTTIRLVTSEDDTEGEHNSLIGKKVPSGILVYQIYGPLFFGAAKKMEEVLNAQGILPEVLILRMHQVTSMDDTALNTLETIVDAIHHRKKHIILSGTHTQPHFMMGQAGFLEKLGPDGVAGTLDEALRIASKHLPQ